MNMYFICMKRAFSFFLSYFLDIEFSRSAAMWLSSIFFCLSFIFCFFLMAFFMYAHVSGKPFGKLEGFTVEDEFLQFVISCFALLLCFMALVNLVIFFVILYLF